MAFTFTLNEKIVGLCVIEPQIRGDERGYFAEMFKQSEFVDHGLSTDFVQDNESVSARGTLRGLHYQLPPHEQGKLVRCVAGTLFDVAVDIRQGSPSYGEWFGLELSAANKKLLWIPAGFAHGFLSLADDTKLVYKVAGHEYNAEADRSIRWNDPQIGIQWPLAAQELLLSDKDRTAPLLEAADNTFRFQR